MGRAGVEPTALEKNNFAVAEDKLHRNLPQDKQFFNMLRLIGKKNSLFTTCRGRVISYYSSSSAIRNPWLKDTAFTRFFLNCGSCFFDRHLHSHCCLCPKFLSPHAFGAFLHPVLTCLAIPLYSRSAFWLRQAVPSRRRPSYLILTAAF